MMTTSMQVQRPLVAILRHSIYIYILTTSACSIGKALRVITPYSPRAYIHNEQKNGMKVNETCRTLAWLSPLQAVRDWSLLRRAATMDVAVPCRAAWEDGAVLLVCNPQHSNGTHCLVLRLASCVIVIAILCPAARRRDAGGGRSASHASHASQGGHWLQALPQGSHSTMKCPHRHPLKIKPEARSQREASSNRQESACQWTPEHHQLIENFRTGAT